MVKTVLPYKGRSRVCFGWFDNALSTRAGPVTDPSWYDGLGKTLFNFHMDVCYGRRRGIDATIDYEYNFLTWVLFLGNKVAATGAGGGDVGSVDIPDIGLIDNITDLMTLIAAKFTATPLLLAVGHNAIPGFLIGGLCARPAEVTGGVIGSAGTVMRCSQNWEAIDIPYLRIPSGWDLYFSYKAADGNLVLETSGYCDY